MEIGTIQHVDIDDQMRSAYMDYAMSVIVARALPDVRDGLKPVHRRILFAMHELGMHSTGAYKKSARIVGEVLGKYHPHGDMAVYDAMARMAQDFSMRYPLVDGQGNFGSIDGDSPAAMRYTEARLGKAAEEMLLDIDKETIDMVDNFDGSLQEPVVLPSRLPNLLLNGSSGIAVGMATNIPPHNLRELSKAISYLIDRYDDIDDVTVEELTEYLTGPDFPTGGIIIGREGILQAYSTGRGRLIIRGVAHIEELRGGRHAIIITEIPYQVNKTSLIERIADLARDGRIDAISDLRDESDRRGMSIVIELKRGATPKKVLNQLYKYTPLQSTFGVHLLALVHGEPRALTLKRALHHFIQHRVDVITRRSEYELDKAKKRAHILEGLMTALNNIDAVIQTIKESPDADTARTRLMSRFKLTEVQAQAILDLQLRRLAALERQKIEEEQREVLARIAYLEDLLSHPKKILGVIQADMAEISERFGDERRTRIARDEVEDFKEEDLVADEDTLISITQRGYIKRVSPSVYKASRNRGRKGVTGGAMREEDEVLMLLHARTLHTILFFSDRGKVYSEKAYQIPDANRTDKGIPVVNLLSVDPGERITAAVAVPGFDREGFLFLTTLNGRAKRLPLAEMASVRPSGMLAMNLDTRDELGWVRLTGGEDEIIIVTRNGMALRMSENEVRAMGRQATGVAGVRLGKGDQVASMEVVEPGGDLLMVTSQGFAKRSPLKDYPAKSRGSRGVISLSQKNLDKTGGVAAARVVQADDEVTLISAGGMVVRMEVKNIPLSGRATRGSRAMNLSGEDTVASVARIPTVSEIDAGNGNGQ